MQSARSNSLARYAAILAVLLTGVLPGCTKPEPPSRPDLRLPEVPATLRQCFASSTELPPGKTWTQAETVEVLAKVRASELAKTSCGRRLLALYDGVRS